MGKIIDGRQLNVIEVIGGDVNQVESWFIPVDSTNQTERVVKEAEAFMFKCITDGGTKLSEKQKEKILKKGSYHDYEYSIFLIWSN
jgi:hypothetical protein